LARDISATACASSASSSGAASSLPRKSFSRFSQLAAPLRPNAASNCALYSLALGFFSKNGVRRAKSARNLPGSDATVF